MAIEIPVTIAELAGVGRTGEGVHAGIPLAPGTVRSPDELQLANAQGQAAPAQFETLSPWQDGSVRWRTGVKPFKSRVENCCV